MPRRGGAGVHSRGEERDARSDGRGLGAAGRLAFAATVPEGVRPLGIELVGNYALSIRWSDGHATGIYAFRSLREDRPYEPCVKALRARTTARRAR